MRLRLSQLESLETRSMLTTFFVEAGAAGGDGSANNPFGSIQDAVDAAASADGKDTINIRAGVYAENVDIEDNGGLTLKGQGKVVIKHPEIDEGEEPEDIIKADGSVTFRNLRVEGLFLDEDLGGRGIDAENGNFQLTNVKVSGTDGDSIRVRDFGSLKIKNSSFSSLNADGIDIEDGGSVDIANTNANNNADEGLEIDDVESVNLVGGRFMNNGDDGVDIDSAREVRVVNIRSEGNAGNGFQAEAENVDMAIVLIGNRLNNNEENGVQVVDVEKAVDLLTIISNRSTNNDLAAFDIAISGLVVSIGNSASGNGDNSLP